MKIWLLDLIVIISCGLNLALSQSCLAKSIHKTTLSSSRILQSATVTVDRDKDYRSRTIYFLVTDRFNPHTPYNPYINSDNDDPYNRVGMTQWSENTPVFKIIKTLARLRKDSLAISQGEYITLYADEDVLVFERRYGEDVVVVAVNRGSNKTITIPGLVDLAPGSYKSILTSTSNVNQGNRLIIRPNKSTIYLQGLSSLVVWSQQKDR